jgi:hypothetical protein
MKRLMIILMVLVSTSVTIQARELETVVDRVSFHGYDDQGAFVVGGTTCGNYLGLGISIIPAGAFYSLSYLAGVSDENCNNVAFYTTKGITVTCGAIIGAPFLILKAIAWDTPKYLFGGLSPYSDDEVKIDSKNQETPQKTGNQAD